MRIFLALTAIALLSIPATSRADTISTFNIVGASTLAGFGDKNTVAGTTTIDITTGVVQSISFTAGGFFESGVNSQAGPVVFVGADNAMFSVSAGSLINFNGGNFNLREPNDLYVGQLTAGTPVSATPEPETLVLLGTGLLGTLGVARRKMARGAARR